MDEKELEAIVAWLRSRAPSATFSEVGRVKASEPFDETEAAEVARAVRKRRDEFHTGRNLARTALMRLGCVPGPIAVDCDRVPIWPSGFVGSISHTNAICLAHVGRSIDLVGIGVDLEPIAPLPAGLVHLISRPDELSDSVGRLQLMRFVAKEAFFKAYFPPARAFLEFHDVRVEIDCANSTFLATIVANDKPLLGGVRAFEGHLAQFGDHLLAGLWIHRS